MNLHFGVSGLCRRSLSVRIAIISDIHSNSIALSAVMAEIESSSIDEIICLGDIIGYGPDPLTCIDVVQEKCSLALLGNHDFACRTQPVNFNQLAREAALWTKNKLETAWPDDAARERRIKFLDQLPVRRLFQDDSRLLCVHGSSRCATNEYVFPDDVEDNARFDRLFQRFEGICFEGHTHMPVVFEQETRTDDDGVEHSTYTRYLGYREDGRSPGPDGTGTIRGASKVPLTLSANRKYIINPGSVGQPRDRDPWACWAILDFEPDSDEMMISFRRTYYDWHRVLEMIRHSQQADEQLPYRLDEFLGARLERGH